MKDNLKEEIFRKRQKAHQWGIRAENRVVWFLRFKGYGILERRFRSPVGEVDIIALKGKTIVFIEVKARKNDLKDIITHSQQKRIIRAATLFVSRNKKYATLSMRFDVVFVQPRALPTHVKNVWLWENGL